jgi:Protein of unknown function (DUF2939)
MHFLSRHAIGVLIIVVIVAWALFYVPTTPSYAVFQLKQAIDARDGATATTYVDFPSVIRNAGYEMVQRNAGAGGDVITSLVGKSAIDLLAQPMAVALQSWTQREVDDGAREVQMPAGAVVGAIFALHRSDDTAWTDFRDAKGQQWDIRMMRENGRWKIVQVKNIDQLLERLKQDQEKQLGHPLVPGAPAPGAPPENTPEENAPSGAETPSGS